MVDDSFEGFHLTALDARRFDFGREFRGYDRARVDQFREQVAGELERLTRAYQELEQQTRYEHEQLQMFRDRDAALNEALIGAQQLRTDIKAQAEREAQLIVREAQAEADKLLQGVRDELRRSEEEVHALWRRRRSYLAQLRHHLERQLTELNAAESGPLPEYTEPRSLSAARAESAEAQEVHGVPERLPERVPERLPFTPPWLAVVEDEP